jgi:hypothetical protein
MVPVSHQHITSELVPQLRQTRAFTTEHTSSIATHRVRPQYKQVDDALMALVAVAWLMRVMWSAKFSRWLT